MPCLLSLDWKLCKNHKGKGVYVHTIDVRVTLYKKEQENSSGLESLREDNWDRNRLAKDNLT